MKLSIVDSQNKTAGKKELPQQFQEEYRPDLIRRAVQALQSLTRQRYGTDPLAGLRHSSSVSKRRRDYRGCYGFGISRVNRKIHSRRGTRMSWIGAFSPQTVGGRRSHPPKAEKILAQKMNAKENRKAIRSAMAAVVHREIVEKRGHKVPTGYPFILDSAFEALNKTTTVEQALSTLGFQEELDRSAVKKVRAGIGKLRGRRYQRKTGLLIVVSEDCPVIAAARNIPGVDIVPARALNAELLAPGALPGRATLWTEKAIEAIAKQNLFI